MTKFVRLATCIALFAMLFSFTAAAQQIETPTGDRTWEEMMADPTTSFYETQAKFNAFWEGRTVEKGKGFKAFKRWEHYMAPRVTPITGEWPEPDAVWQAMQEQPEMFTTNENMPGDWTYIGNTSVPNGGGAGRVNSVRPLPGSTTTWFACAPGGGLWKTTNSGTSWSIVGTDFLSSIGVSDVAIDPGNTNIMYIATGDGDAGDTYSLGVLKSTDGGATWNTTGLSWSVTQTRRCSRIIMHPSNSQLLICATSNGIWRTTDGGVNWTQELSVGCYEVTFKPGDPSVVYGVSDQFYKSTDTGDNWSVVTTGLPTSGDSQRMAMAVTSANSDYVYVLASANNSGLLGVYRSTDSGTTFTTQTTTPNLLGWNANGGDTGGQGWYDLCITVDPTDANIVYTGGVNIWKSTNGGTTFALNGHWFGGGGVPYVHADNHYLGFIGTRLTVGNDGGVFSTTNGGPNWTDNSSNLAIAQQYKLGLATLNANLVLTGWQDNGTNLKNGAVHSEVYGGDGMECAIDATNSNIMYATLYYGSIQRSTNGGAGWSNIVGSGGANEDENGAWVTPYVLGANQAHIFVGKSVVYKSTNSGGTFTASAAFGGTGDCNDMALAPSDNNIVFASKGGSLFKSTDNAATFAAVGAGLPGYFIEDIAVHNTDPNKIWVVVSNYAPGEKVYYSSNGGSSWTNISGTLPNLPANAIVFQNGTNNGIYVGMDAGIYYRDDVLGAWVPHMNLLPNVVISELEIHYATSTISAATYGRGLWRAPLYTLAALDAVLTQVISPTGSSCNTTITPQIEVLNAGTTTITAMNIQYQVVGQAVQNFPWAGTLASTTSTTITMPTLNYGAGAFTINFNITSVNGGADDNTANNAGTNNYITISGTNTATLTLITDCYPSETSWQITDGSANVIHSGSGYPSNTTNTIPLCLPNDCFTFTIFDSYGDGLNGLPFGCPFNGDYTITDNATSTVLVDMAAPGGAFGFSASHNFCFPLSSVPGCTNSAACNYNAAATIDDGSCVFVANDLCAGAITIPSFGVPVAVSTVGTCQDGPNPNCGGTQIKDVWYKFTYAGGTVAITTAGGTLTDTRLAVYSSCGGAQIACDDDDGAGNYSLINFGCTTGNGAAGANEATLLVQGQTYYIQAGGYNGLTGTFNLTVTVTNVVGCTNVSACNYNPCANVNSGCVLPSTWYLNADGDNYYVSTQTSCTSPGAGYVNVAPSGGAGDCNDANAAINPGATELLCDGIDNNCNSVIDEGRINGCTNVSACNYNAAATCDNGSCTFAITWYLNADGDNYYASTQSACTSPGAGYTSTLPSGGAGDCNDANAAINPGATEVCNGVDDDCDASIDEGFDIDNDGFTICEGDCNDNNNNIFPGAPEACNGIDDDCDSVIDDNVTTQNYYTDVDGDGFGSNLIGNFCSPPVNSSLNNTDCDDNNSAINPNATEVCNGIDDDCDSVIDDNVITQNYYNDMDGDGFGAGLIGNFCSPPSNSSLTNDDCNDNNAAVRPGATEVCNGIDDDCNGSIDDNVVTQNYYNDVDGDGFGAGLIGNLCSPPANSSLTNNDCNDNNAAIHPGVTDVCNSIDDDCDGSTDEDGTLTWWLNADGDNYAAATQSTCTSPGAGWTTTAPQFNGDCNDNNAAINPGAIEICANGIDDNCNGFIDEGCGGGVGFDNMSGAVSVSSNNNIYPSCTVLNGTCAGATISAEGNPLNVITGEDVWYKFTAVSPGVRVIVNTTAFDAVIELHNNLGAELNAENLTGMAGTEILNYAGLTEGAQYFVAIRNYNSALGNGAFTVCIQALMDSRCDEGSGTYALCSNFKPDWTGASNYVFNFTPSLGGATTSASYAGQIPLSTPALALQNGVAYINTVDAVYYLSNGTGSLETIVVVGNETCNVQIGPHANEQVKVQQRCPAILFKSGILQAKPFVCGAIQHEFEFTQVDIANVPIGLPFSKLTTGASSTLAMSFTTPQALMLGARYSVRVKPIFSYGPGTFGTPQCIEISSVSYTLDPNEMTPSLQEERSGLNLEVALYPNPTTGEMVHLNVRSELDGAATVSVMDGMGRVIYSTSYVVEGNLSTVVHFAAPLANGLYTVEVMLNGERITQRLMVQK